LTPRENSGVAMPADAVVAERNKRFINPIGDDAMKLNTKRWSVAFAAAAGAALATTLALPAVAQTDAGGMPQEQHQGDATFVSGGVGLDESQALRSAASHWPLSLRFTGPGADYLADVHVRIEGGKAGGEILSADARGPYMLVRLPPGKYTVHAKYKDSEQTRAVTIAGNGAKAEFHWNQQ
jgi:hypothetical protein